MVNKHMRELQGYSEDTDGTLVKAAAFYNIDAWLSILDENSIAGLMY
jgi:hypothetical protein